MQRWVAIAVLVSAGAVSAQTPGLWFTGLPSGATQGAVAALSADAQVAGGNNGPVGAYSPGFGWTREGGRFDFGLLPGMPHVTAAAALNANGSVMAGVMWDQALYPAPDTRAFVWTGSGPLQNLGVLPNETRSYARGISGDGSIVVGACEHSSSTEFVGQAFRWTQATGMQPLGYTRPGGGFSQARAVSRDGSTIVGISKVSGVYNDAFVWTQGTGMQQLPSLPGTTTFQNDANAVSADGSVIVGSGKSPTTTTTTAIRWTSTGPQDLGSLPGYLRSVAYAVSDSGAVIGGRLYTGLPDSAFVWSATTGMSLLPDLLAGAGVAVSSSYRLETIYAISGDGLTFAGQARNINDGTLEGFVATIPAPGPLLILALPALARRRPDRRADP